MTQDLGQVTSVYNNLGQNITRMYNNRNEIIWEKNNVIYDESDYRNQYLCIEPIWNGYKIYDNVFSYVSPTSYANLNLYCKQTPSYKINNGEWTNADDWHNDNVRGTYVRIKLYYGDKIYLKLNLSKPDNRIKSIELINTGNDHVYFNVSGNPLSILYGDNFFNQNTININNAFMGLFSHQYLISAENLYLSFNNLSEYCYNDMFALTKIESAPKLNTLSLKRGCYFRMFAECNNLKKAPLLPATILAPGCYESMFLECTNLRYVECYAEVFNNRYDYGDGTYSIYEPTVRWLNNVSSTGIFVKKTGVVYPSNIGYYINGIPNNWEIINL